MRIRLPLRPYLVLARYTRALTLGIRGVVLGPDDRRVLLVRHTYVEGWHFPGGAVEPRETTHQALARELDEEGGIALTGPAELFGLYLNRRYSQRDHVAVFVCRRWRQAHPPKVPNLEIEDARFFDVADLPRGTTEATQRRLAEILRGEPPSADW